MLYILLFAFLIPFTRIPQLIACIFSYLLYFCLVLCYFFVLSLNFSTFLHCNYNTSLFLTFCLVESVWKSVVRIVSHQSCREALRQCLLPPQRLEVDFSFGGKAKVFPAHMSFLIWANHQLLSSESDQTDGMNACKGNQIALYKF